MNFKFNQKAKRLISGFVAAATAITMLPAIPAMAEDLGRYPYTLFAGSSAEGAITTTASNFGVNGNVATNGTISAAGNMNINGTKTENAGLDMIYIFDKIDSKYFSGSDVEEHTEDYVLDELNINISEPTEVLGEAELTGNININTALKAFKDVTLNGEVKNTNDSVIYSKYGDIVIDSTNVNLNGLVYAPFGSVEVKAMNLNLNNVVIIADSIVFDCPNVNANYSTDAADFVGTVSEPLNIPKDEWQYMKDENENGLPDFFENFENWSKLADTDGDGLPDSIEEYLGSDPNNIDTDGDGLNDFYEVFGTYTDPTKADTDENGVNDGDEDFDEDGLTNLEEFENKTNPYINDTDGDGLLDGDEVKTHGTDPLIADTDGDDLDDGDEIILGTSPLAEDTDGNGVIDSKEKFQQTFIHKVKNGDCAVTEVIVDMECTGNINRTTSVESVMNVDMLCTDVVGLVGEPFEIETTSEFDKATLTFKIDKNKLGEIPFDNLLFLWYNEKDREFVELDTVLDEENCAISIVTSHFSKYMIVNKCEWFEAWKNAPNYFENGDGMAVDTVITIDTSSSMSSEISTAITAAQKYIATMKDGDRTAIVGFSTNASVVQKLTGDKDELYSALKRLRANGNTNFDEAIKVTMNAFEDDNDKIKVVIFMSDGSPTVDASNDALEMIRNGEATFYAVGYGNANSYKLQQLSRIGNGEYYLAKNAQEFIDIYQNIGLANISLGPDTDDDGLADIFEIAGMLCINGRVYYTDPNKADTDGDGLTDGEEIELQRSQVANEAYRYIFYFNSHPHAADMYNTGMSDYDRANGTSKFSKSYLVEQFTGPYSFLISAGTEAISYPSATSNVVFSYDSDTNAYLNAIIYCDGKYWLKVQYDYYYGVWGYILADDLSSENIVKSSWLWKLSHGEVHVPYVCNAYCEYIGYKFSNVAGRKDNIQIDEDIILYMVDCCKEVRELYSDGYFGSKDKEIKEVISKYLTPELLIAISGTESGYDIKGQNGNGFGLTLGGVKWLFGMIGGETMSDDIDVYDEDYQQSIRAATVCIAHEIRYAINNGMQNFYNNGDLNYAQVIFNSFYFYGAGTKEPHVYYGYEHNGEAGMSAGYKMYIYSCICSQLDIACAIPYDNYDVRISNLTCVNSHNQWMYLFTGDAIYPLTGSLEHLNWSPNR